MPWLSLRLIKGDGFIEGGRVEASAELFIQYTAHSLSYTHIHIPLKCRKLEQTKERLQLI